VSKQNEAEFFLVVSSIGRRWEEGFLGRDRKSGCVPKPLIEMVPIDTALNVCDVCGRWANSDPAGLDPALRRLSWLRLLREGAVPRDLGLHPVRGRDSTRCRSGPDLSQ
jgi:hypothetical protein